MKINGVVPNGLCIDCDGEFPGIYRARKLLKKKKDEIESIW